MTKGVMTKEEKEVFEEKLKATELPKDELTKIAVAKEVPAMEEIVFHNLRDPGEDIEFVYKSKTHPYHRYHLFHGQKYTLPVEVIKHLEGTNEYDPYSCHRRIYGEGVDAYGRKRPVVVSYQPYYQCRTVRK